MTGPNPIPHAAAVALAQRLHETRHLGEYGTRWDDLNQEARDAAIDAAREHLETVAPMLLAADRRAMADDIEAVARVHLALKAEKDTRYKVGLSDGSQHAAELVRVRADEIATNTTERTTCDKH